MRAPSNDSLPLAAASSGLLLLVLTSISYASGTSQQWLEWVRPPDEYTHALRAGDHVLRAIIAVDDVFIAAYVSAGVLLAARLAGGHARLLPMLVGGCSLVAGLLDLEENHHLLAMIELARHDIAIPLDEILARSDRSQFKWMLGHLGFVFAGLALAPTSNATRVVRFALVFVQLPIGALTWAVPESAARDALVLVRYLSLFAGFLLIAWLARRGDALVAVDSGAPA